MDFKHIKQEGLLISFSKFSCWPIFATINEIEPNERRKRENVLLLGLWIGSQPNFNLLLTPLVKSLTENTFDLEVV
jgi:hypothetical protein